MGGREAMNGIVRWVFPLVAYLCVGTVVSAVLGYGYLRHNGTLDDEKLFRIMALLHGLNLEEIQQEGQATVEETPPEELSFAQREKAVQAATLHFDAKQKQLEASLSDFNYQLKQVNEEKERYQQFKRVVEEYLDQQSDKLKNSDLANVRNMLESAIPKKQAKPILIKYIEDGQIETVILLLGSMKERARRDILRTFDTPEDIQMLYQIQEHMLNDNPARALIDEQLDSLKKLKAQDK
jgi:hypothetical protein